MAFLRLLSENVRQNFTYTCINSTAWFNAENETFNTALKFRGDDGREYSHKTFKWLVVRDGCKFRKGNNETVFEINTKKVKRLPIMDFLPIDYGLPDQAFGFSIGPVCFS